MHHETITFQLATHYLSKVALRLECLFLTITQAREETHPVIHHYALKNIIEIIKLIEKPELKSRFLKELMRIEHMLNKSELSISNALYANLFVQIQFLSHVAGRFGGTIHNDPFLQSIRLAQAGDYSDCEMHSPQLLLWLESEPQKRQHDLNAWLKQLQTLFDTVSVYLALLRNTAEFDKIDMFSGFYQRSLPSKTSCHLILLRMDKDCGIVPKMQLGHHGLSLRLCEANSMNEVRHANTAIDLAICQL
ncbi:cell division protein ZapD [Legionella nagasakiensis]|uniref:cell division protein ZapD n=1 Tax=Legionella nagasakiensis TaxID=535290 RepID=UPI001055AE4C|nr:cell division protein ZapD [Legionella nagasakiensis]